jgi:hypothetical protein|tara:strand:+ start:689 stop:898 length:210 start_codon:yes stop_codon:yes gene_type:complete
MNMRKPTNDYEALVHALVLAIDTTVSKEKSDKCLVIAEEIANRLSASEVAKAKKEAEDKNTVKEFMRDP